MKDHPVFIFKKRIDRVRSNSWNVFIHVEGSHVNMYTYMAAIALPWNINMAPVKSREKALLQRFVIGYLKKATYTFDISIF